ncbi:hypothetical protein MPL3356_60544 [Mesorhizobium plurifarium]|uniref:Uncharacterized protein n=1 Tax=Mesorhizobium plurifarium TaxID=69974 RepID=A0A090E9Z7_MESPL|nr:hypothetical protein MPL3356_60544 [Mesorhizobium plurifarium]
MRHAVRSRTAAARTPAHGVAWTGCRYGLDASAALPGRRAHGAHVGAHAKRLQRMRPAGRAELARVGLATSAGAVDHDPQTVAGRGDQRSKTVNARRLLCT